jgi:hypothetical protein
LFSMKPTQNSLPMVESWPFAGLLIISIRKIERSAGPKDRHLVQLIVISQYMNPLILFKRNYDGGRGYLYLL